MKFFVDAQLPAALAILFDLFNINLDAIVKLFSDHNFIEFDNYGLNVHE